MPQFCPETKTLSLMFVILIGGKHTWNSMIVPCLDVSLKLNSKLGTINEVQDLDTGQSKSREEDSCI